MKPSRGQPIVVCLFALFFSLNNCLAADKKPSGLGDYLKKLGYFEIQMERNRDNQLVVDASFKKEKHYLLVDTGCTFTCIDSKITSGITKVDGQTKQFDDKYLRRVHATNLVSIDELKLGGLLFQNQPALRRDIKMDYVSLSERGIIGSDFLFRNNCIVDCARGRLYVRPEEPPDNIRSALSESLQRSKFADVPLGLSLGCFTCEARANGTTTRMLVDTGFVWSSLDDVWARTNNVRAYTKETNIIGFGPIGSHGTHAGVLDTLQLGSATFKNVYVALTALTAWKLGMEDEPGRDIHGILGAETLAEIGAIIDFSSRKMWFNPSNQAR